MIEMSPGKRNSVVVVPKVQIAASVKLSRFWTYGRVKENVGSNCPEASRLIGVAFL
jgi:hypothetical protein